MIDSFSSHICWTDNCFLPKSPQQLSVLIQEENGDHSFQEEVCIPTVLLQPFSVEVQTVNTICSLQNPYPAATGYLEHVLVLLQIPQSKSQPKI